MNKTKDVTSAELKALSDTFSDEDKDDFAMTIGNLFFRMEEMDFDTWWVQIYIGEAPYFFGGNIIDGRINAINALVQRGQEILNKQKQRG